MLSYDLDALLVEPSLRRLAAFRAFVRDAPQATSGGRGRASTSAWTGVMVAAMLERGLKAWIWKAEPQRWKHRNTRTE
jgi:hypothetical protein